MHGESEALKERSSLQLGAHPRNTRIRTPFTDSCYFEPTGLPPPPIPSSASTSSLFFSFSQKHRINGRARSPQFPRRLFERNRFGNDPLAILRSGRLCSVTKRDENPRARQHNPERDVLRNAKDRRGFITRSSLDSREGRSYANVINVVPKSLSYPAKRALGASGTEMGTIRELGEHTHTHTHRQRERGRERAGTSSQPR